MSFRDPSSLALNRRRYRGVNPDDRDGADEHAADAAAPLGLEGGTRRIRRIVLTGGPGSGKSTAASFLAREFVTDLWVLPEAATLLYRGGMPRGNCDVGVQIAQRSIFSVQRSLEQAHGVQHPDRVQLCDRGTIDGAAYWAAGSDAFFRAMASSHERELARYDAVIFLHTSATLPAGYERDLEVRTEDRDQAIALDRRIFDLYRDHPRLISIESQVSFLDKLTIVREAVRDLIADGQPGAGAGGSDAAAARRGGASAASHGPAPACTLANLGSITHLLP